MWAFWCQNVIVNASEQTLNHPWVSRQSPQIYCTFSGPQTSGNAHFFHHACHEKSCNDKHPCRLAKDGCVFPWGRASGAGLLFHVCWNLTDMRIMGRWWWCVKVHFWVLKTCSNLCDYFELCEHFSPCYHLLFVLHTKTCQLFISFKSSIFTRSSK